MEHHNGKANLVAEWMRLRSRFNWCDMNGKENFIEKFEIYESMKFMKYLSLPLVLTDLKGNLWTNYILPIQDEMIKVQIFRKLKDSKIKSCNSSHPAVYSLAEHEFYKHLPPKYDLPELIDAWSAFWTTGPQHWEAIRQKAHHLVHIAVGSDQPPQAANSKRISVFADSSLDVEKSYISDEVEMDWKVCLVLCFYMYVPNFIYRFQPLLIPVCFLNYSNLFVNNYLYRFILNQEVKIDKNFCQKELSLE